MANERWILDGHRFVNEAEYEAALRDYTKINDIKKKVDFSNEKSVKELYGELQTGQITFESVLGQEFDDMVFETYTEFARNGENRDEQHSNQNYKKNSSTGKKQRTVQKEKKTEQRISLEDFDDEMRKQIIRELKKKERIRRGVLIGCGIVAFACLLYFGIYQYMTIRTQNDAQQLANLIKEEESFVVPNTEDDKYYASVVESSDGMPEILHKYEDLYNQNKSLIGWVKIADTIIDYPVMQTVNNEYYLDHNFYQEYDKNGSIFLDASCSIYPRSTNLIIYGHHMKSGSMFGSLQNYQSESYYEAHKYIQFDTIYEQGTYEVMFVFRDRVYSQEDVNFKYYEFIDANSEEEFYSYMNEMAAASYYETGVVAQYGDRLLTLSTCDYQQDNGRFVVVAREVTD